MTFFHSREEQGCKLCLLVSPKRLLFQQSYDEARGPRPRFFAWQEFGQDPGRLKMELQFEGEAMLAAWLAGWLAG